MALHPFAPLIGIYSPTFIYPANILPSPKTPFINYGFNIDSQEYIFNENPKAIVVFIGGFCDTIMCAVYREFIAFNKKSCIKIYASFKSTCLFSDYLPILSQSKLPLFVIAHSWGASNFYKAMCNINSNHISLHYLLTLDPVGYNTPHNRPIHINLWENVYIDAKSNNLCRTNILALIGGAWNSIKVSDNNIALCSPIHHASISQMMQYSHFVEEITKIAGD